MRRGRAEYPKNCWTMERPPLSVFVCFSCPPLKHPKGELSNMSEAIISRRGYGPEGKPHVPVFQTKTFTQNTQFVVPETILNNTIDVFIYGGGGGGARGENSNSSAGGGGGWMNKGTITVTPLETIQIVVGKGGNPTVSGESSSFGVYLSANGGSSGGRDGGDGGSGGGGYTPHASTDGGNGHQFGGGGGYNIGGDGGVWGGGGGSITGPGHGGDGGTYGGGGCGVNGGDGGTYGGGGAATNRGYMAYGRGGTYGGNGGGWNNTRAIWNAENGTNTSSWTNVDMINGEYLRGWGVAGQYINTEVNGRICGGGGFGGNGGQYAGGGGGYGSNGGSDDGGGGGYGGDGGNNCGGGGGYGKSAIGGSGDTTYRGGGGGGGYFGRGGHGMSGCGGGGGGYGNGGDGDGSTKNGGIGAGGGGHNGYGGNGICILQYYA